MREVDLRKVLQKLGIRDAGRKRANGWIEFRCPLAPFTHRSRHDSRPSAAAKVNDNGTSSWTCATCHGHGRLSRLASELQRYHPNRAAQFGSMIREIDEIEVQTARNAVIEIEMPPFEATESEQGLKALIEEQFVGLFQSIGTNADARQYMINRGIHSATAKKLGLVYDEHHTEQAVERRILFPVRGRAGELYGFTGRTIDESVKPKVRDYAGLPKRALMLGAERWRPGKPLIVVEGLFAYAHLHEVGVEEIANIGALLGSIVTPEKAALIRAFDEPVYLLLDNDDAGDVGIFGRILPEGTREIEQSAVHQLIRTVPVMVPEWPTWTEDGVLLDGTAYQAGDQKTDPDQLTLEEVRDMLTWTGPVMGI
jgi:hypothetical protein